MVKIKFRRNRNLLIHEADCSNLSPMFTTVRRLAPNRGRIMNYL
ncbi:TPA: hypothetical protein ACN4VF_002155 [Staphylococcus aureus]